MNIANVLVPPPAPPEPDAPGPVAVRWAKHPKVTARMLYDYIRARRDAFRIAGQLLERDDMALELLVREKYRAECTPERRRATAEERRRLAELREREATLFEASLKALRAKQEAEKEFWSHVGGFANAEWLSQESRSLEDASPHDPYTAYRREQVARYEELRAQLREAEAAYRAASAAWMGILRELRALEAEVAE